MIVIEDKNAAIVFVARAARARITRAQVTVFDIFWNGGLNRRRAADRLPLPWPVLAVRRDDDPFLS